MNIDTYYRWTVWCGVQNCKSNIRISAQIGHVCGGTNQGWYGRKELFVALKLVAAAQRGLPVRTESLFLGVDLPLPRLHTNNNTHYGKLLQTFELK